MSKKFKLQQNDMTKAFRIIEWEETRQDNVSPRVISYKYQKEWYSKSEALAVLNALREQEELKRRAAKQYWVDVDENEEYSS